MNPQTPDLRGTLIYRTRARLFELPFQLWIGLAMVAVCWPLNWLLPGLRTHLLFFPLWLGYALTVDGLVYLRSGTSLLTRSWKSYIGLFLISAPAWWLFELINLRTQNWEYFGRGSFTDWQYALLASVSFSTVMPAVFGTAELMATFPFVREMRRGMVIKQTQSFVAAMFALGLVMLTLLLVRPQLFFPLVWLSVFFILEPVNIWRAHRSLTKPLHSGDWRPVVSLWLGTLTCGLFWELWNFLAYPKWVYHVPLVDFVHIFEMPILGYGGYLPFGMELFALYSLVTGLLGHALVGYIKIDADGPNNAA